MRAALASLLALGVVFSVSAARADGEGAAVQTAPGVFVMPNTVIVGRPNKPAAVIEIQRVQPWIAVKELSRPVAPSAEDATKRAPF